MTWNYRVIETCDPETTESMFAVHEVYYDDEGNVEAWTENPVSCLGDCPDELRADIHFHHRAFLMPVLMEKMVNNETTLVETAPIIRPNAGHYYEFWDRVCIASDFLYQTLGSYPLLRAEKKLKQLYIEVDQAIGALYSEAAEMGFDKIDRSGIFSPIVVKEGQGSEQETRAQKSQKPPANVRYRQD
ncbi:hypothetical protein [Endozoicomonas lisbonensis]|uniref:Uncharacterized protein n=1 Tax=Endozoicomonas lisbonensis TaxID=3120522 RepID=A0ABV2SNR9_9GAMM